MIRPSLGLTEPAAFGKLPAHGDFLSLGLPPGLVELWDRHFRRVLLRSWLRLERRTRPGADAPVWRCLLAGGLCGTPTLHWGGIAVFGRDRHGRSYPTLLARGIPARTAAACLQDRRWLAQLESAWRDVADGARSGIHGLLQASRGVSPDAAGPGTGACEDTPWQRWVAHPAGSLWWQEQGRDVDGLVHLPGLPDRRTLLRLCRGRTSATCTS